MKRKLTSIAISVILVLEVAVFQGVEDCRADPFPFKIMDEVPPDNSTQPPTIDFLSPRNSTSYNFNDLILSVVAEVGFSAIATYAPHPYISEIYYKTDFQMTPTTVYKYGQPQYGSKTFSKYNATIPLNSLSEGNHAITVYAVENGRYESNNGSTVLYYPFKITGSSSMYFVIDNTKPLVQIIQPENKTYNTVDIPLNLRLTEPSEILCSIDNHANITLAGNTTLTGLSDDSHSLIIYANDTAGNVGTSDTVFFTVNTQPIPTPTPTPSISPSGSPTQQPPSSPTSLSPDYYEVMVNALPLVLGIIALSMAVAGAVLFLLVRCRRLT